MKRLYLCNGQKKDCSKTNCYKNNGDCRHTFDKKYRINKSGGVFDHKYGLEIERQVPENA